ncbi:hypothetical protein PHMEG_00013259 [Phytophthora megakarya]|uniref:Uncharacterized protein n=1 Tax=Phytophthora megakarya TaxID=4795 RepID=A0A225W6R7_9STRA|nr:hypothetical protein PHMEG_00013259 [Phytophthora megakarya]
MPFLDSMPNPIPFYCPGLPHKELARIEPIGELTQALFGNFHRPTKSGYATSSQIIRWLTLMRITVGLCVPTT